MQPANYFGKSTTLLTCLLILFDLAAIVAPSNKGQNVFRQQNDEFSEALFLKPLLDGKLLAQFEFETLYRGDIKNLRWENKFEIFPLSLADLVASTDLNKLHFSLTKGNWNYRNWGYQTQSTPPGAQIRVQFSPHNEDPKRSWQRLINSLAGKFCASLASADKKTLVASKLAFCDNSVPPNSTEHVLYTNLPEETFCTENLTPWKKLLPCYSNSGLASLLNAVNLLKSSYSSLAIDLEPKPCANTKGLVVPDCEQVQLKQSIVVVLNPLQLFEGKQTWSLAKIFGNSIQRTCPIASSSRIFVDITDLDDINKLYPKAYQEQKLFLNSADGTTQTRRYATYDVKSLINNSNKNPLNLGIKQNHLFKRPPMSQRPKIPVFLKTHVAGVGAADGTTVATITNDFSEQVRLTYLDVVPHYLRVYLHTLTIRTKSGQEIKPDKLNFALSRDSSPTLIEFSMIVPAKSEVKISYDFETAFLRWTEYKPDANKGVLLGSAMIRVSSCSTLANLAIPITSTTHLSNDTTLDCSFIDNDNKVIVYARPLLIILPTPDFSMPYNVVTIVCTTLVAAIGPIYSMTTSKPVEKKKEKQPLDKGAESKESTAQQVGGDEDKKKD